MSPNQFKLRPEALAAINRKSRLTYLVLIIAFLCLAVGIPVFTTQSKNFDFYTMLPPLVVIGVAGGFSFYRTNKRNRDLMESYRVTIEFGFVSMELTGAETLTLFRNEIVEITKTPTGIFKIMGGNIYKSIGIPAGIEQPELVEKLLNEIRPVKIDSGNGSYNKYTIPITLVIGLLMAVFAITKNKLVAAFTGIPLIVALLFSLALLRNNKYFPESLKRLLPFGYLVAASLAGALILKLLGFD